MRKLASSVVSGMKKSAAVLASTRALAKKSLASMPTRDAPAESSLGSVAASLLFVKSGGPQTSFLSHHSAFFKPKFRL